MGGTAAFNNGEPMLLRIFTGPGYAQPHQVMIGCRQTQKRSRDEKTGPSDLGYPFRHQLLRYADNSRAGNAWAV